MSIAALLDFVLNIFCKHITFIVMACACMTSRHENSKSVLIT